MTEKLTTLLHDQADSITFAVPDVEAMAATGDRRLRRRRLGVAAGATALAVALGVGLGTVLPGADDTAPPPAGPGETQTRRFEPMAVIGPRVFVGDQMVVLGQWPDRLVRTQAGFAYTSGDDVRSWVDGRDEVVGASDGWLVSDQDSSLVAWTEPDVVDGTIELLDQRTGERREIGGPDTGRSLVLDALDGDVLYVSTSGRSVAVDLVDGSLRELDADLSIMGVENGVLAAYGDDGTVLGPVDDPAARVEVDAGDVGVLSPDGRWYAASDVFWGDVDPSDVDAGVVDVATGDRLRLDIDAAPRDIVEPSGWIDDDTVTVAVVPLTDQRPEQLLACDVPSGGCTVVIADHDALPGRSGMGKDYPGGGYS